MPIIRLGFPIGWATQLSFPSVIPRHSRCSLSDSPCPLHLVLSLTGFLLLEQLLITDGTVAPLNRLRIVYAIGAAIALFIFGISAAIAASRHYGNYPYGTYHRGKIRRFHLKQQHVCPLSDAALAAVIAFLGGAVYVGEAVARNSKSRII